MNDCILCSIIAGESPVSSIHEDDVALALLTISPINPGHVMVIPKKHFTYLDDMDEDTGMHLMKIALRVQKAIRNSGVHCEGINLFLADGEAAFQDVFHVHLHIFPRFKGDSFKINADFTVKPSREELDEVAEKIRQAYKSLPL
jgi:histidine triad (HIT) family protein|tara:strand:+ start:185 stop:616 length:432 start_codon:yes stop_codon:yes gene_type:complete